MERSDFLDFDCLAYGTRRTGRAVTNLFNARLAHLDLNVAQFGLLAAVSKMPGATLAAIGEAMLLDESTLARNFAVMERRGLVAAEGGRGRSGKQLRLTKEGLSLAKAASIVWTRTNKHLAAEFSEGEVAAGRAFLKALGEASQRLRTKDEAIARREAARNPSAKA
jgi:DNA-binding MarR family transcriptional regulator